MTTATNVEPDIRPADPCAMVIFGASGDLTKRKLLPSLHNLLRNGLLSPNFAIIGVAMDPLTDESFRARMRDGLLEFGGEIDPMVRERSDALSYVQGKFDDPDTYIRLRERLQAVDKTHCPQGNTLFYLATPPQFFGVITTHLGAARLVSPPTEGGPWTRLVVEKPFGRDLESAQALNRELLTVFDESQIYRIDHYLGKETVQNILLFRFVNSIFEPIWNRRYIEHVQMTVAESIGIEGRGAYFDTAGILRDIIQNHMFQLLCLMAMEPPISFAGEEVRNEKVKVLHAVRPMEPEEILQRTVRGQYGPGVVDGQRVPGYRQEPGVAPSSTTETYAALKLYVENWRWADVPFYLRAGKRLAARDTEIVVQFRRAPLILLRDLSDHPQPNRLTIHVQPDERITLHFAAKRPGPKVRLAPVNMAFAYKDLGDGNPSTGYETLLYDCMVGDSMLFHRADMVEAAWRVATPVLDVWQALPPRDFPNYAAGTWGPRSANDLLAADGHEWVTPE